jgi:hypothetical protein
MRINLYASIYGTWNLATAIKAAIKSIYLFSMTFLLKIHSGDKCGSGVGVPKILKQQSKIEKNSLIKTGKAEFLVQLFWFILLYQNFWYKLIFFTEYHQFWEGVGTSKIRTSKGQNVESFFKDDQNVERSERGKSEHPKECRKSNLSDFQVLMKCQLPMG